ncbi:type II secretion system protein [Paenibacillus sp. FSL H8-0048]|uniref:type II secretion system protein n=1 Tax=Paenibacillus sp. FSL H8-0048 TaxID=2954508 RepID=UPI0030F5DC80
MFAQALRTRLGKAVKEEKGFTLIELLAVIVIMGIIAVIAIPMISGLINKTGEKADLATARQIYEASRMYITTEFDGKVENLSIDVIEGTGTKAGKGLQIENYLENPLVLPSNKHNIVSGTVNYSGGKLANGTNGYAIVIADGTGTSAVTRRYTAQQILESKL